MWNHPSGEEVVISKQFILAILAFIVPLSDTTTVVINRIAKGKSPFVGGKDHTTHHLSYLGLSDQSVALLLGGIGIFSTVVILIVLSIQNWTHLFTILFALYAIVVFVSLYLTTQQQLWSSKDKNDNEDEKKLKKTA